MQSLAANIRYGSVFREPSCTLPLLQMAVLFENFVLAGDDDFRRKPCRVLGEIL